MNDTNKRSAAAEGSAPRVTADGINAIIVGEYFHVPPGTTLTLCVLTLANGFTVVGESACASAENFNAKLGEDIARSNAKDKIWKLEGYALRCRLAEQERK